MIELNGKYNNCKVYTDNIDNATISQLISLLNQKSVEDSRIRIMPDTHAGAGCVIGTTMTLKDKVVPNLVGVDIGCIDCDTEILTPNGWIKISEYNNQDILVYDYFKDCAFFDTPLAYIKNKCDVFYHFKSDKGLDQMLSAEHKMIVWRGYKNKGYTKNIDLALNVFNAHNECTKSNRCIKTTFDYNGIGLNLSDDIIRVLVMISADGRIRYNKTLNSTYVELHFSKERKIKRAMYLLEKANIDYKINTKGNHNTTYISFKMDGAISKDLTQFYMATKHQLSILVDEIYYWDGTIDELRGHKFFSSTMKSNADLVQFAITTQGIRSNLYVSVNSEHENWNDTYVVGQTKNEYVGFPDYKFKTVKSVDGYKYCFTTSTGFFIIRRNNCISITGNCGMLAIKLKEKRIDLPNLDSVIRKYIPSGGEVNENSKEDKTSLNVRDLRCFGKPNAKIREELAYHSVGTLGGGNHFIEVDKDSNNDLWLVIHTGSRHLGMEICNYYQDMGYEALKEKVNGSKKDKINAIIQELKSQGREKEISSKLEEFNKNYKEKNPDVPHELAYVEDELFKDYIHDMDMVQKHASCNRNEIARVILKYAKLHEEERFETIHNYIDVENMILRKGSISAQKGEKVIIPMNMRDGSLICIGKGNEDWNFSAPHGAGRLMSRSEAKENISMKDFKESMKNVFSTSVNKSTIDESPFAYKPMDEIIQNIQDTVEIVDIIKPIYNFKAADIED